VTQATTEGSQELSQIEAAPRQQRVDAVALCALQVVSPQAVILFFVTDHGFDGVAPLEELLHSTACFVLSGQVNPDVFRMVVAAAIAAITGCFLRTVSG
jgi:hypothetical protein